MAEKVGKFHHHELPSTDGVAIREDVYRCNCGTEFYVDEPKRSGIGVPLKEWTEVSKFPALVHYDRTVEGKPFIGHASPETAFDEPQDEAPAEVESDGEPAGDS
jgi:hypothetical protein